MAQATSNLLKPSNVLSDALKKFQSNPLTKFQNATAGGTSPFAAYQKAAGAAKNPVQFPMSGGTGATPPNTGYGTFGAPMSVAPMATKVAQPTTKPASGNISGGSGNTQLSANQTSAPGLLNLSNQNTIQAAPEVKPQVQSQAKPEVTAQPKSFSGLVGTVSEFGEGKKATNLTQAYADYKKAIEDLQKFESSVADTTKEIYDAPTSARVMQGRDAQVQAANEKKRLALQERVNQLQEAIGFGITEQGQQIGAAGTAASLAAPQVTAFGQTAFNPLAGGFGAGGDAQFQQSLEQYAQMAANNQLGAIPATITGNPVLNAQVMERAKQINPNFNFNTAQGTGAAQQTGATIAGTTVPQANQQIYTSALGDYYTMSSMLQNVDQLGGLLLNTAQGAQINPFAPQFANMALSKFRTQLSDADQARFNSSLATFQAAAQSLLANSNSITPTDLGNAIQGIANGSLSLGALRALVDQAKREGGIRLQNQANIVNQSREGTLQGAGGGAAPAQGGSGGGSVGWF